MFETETKFPEAFRPVQDLELFPKLEHSLLLQRATRFDLLRNNRLLVPPEDMP